MTTNYLNELNEQQREAVVYDGGPSLVVAGAGSGKTRVLTYKIVHLVNSGYKPNHILALTFTNKAATEMKERIQSLAGSEVSSRLWMGTFHSIFSKILRVNAERLGFRHDYTIYDATDSKSLVKQIIKERQLDDKVYNPSSVQAHISNVKNALISPDDYAVNKGLLDEDARSNRPEMCAIYRAYCTRCRVSGVMDFDDLLFYTNVLLRDNPDLLAKYQQMFEYILVDEYQDTNFAQHMILLQLSKQHQRICMVGDDAQSIYSFRGANINNILTLSKYFPSLKTFKLERNYRSTKNIVLAANSLIDKNSRQIKKHLFSENGEGEKVNVVQCYSDYEEAYYVVNRIIGLKSRQGCSYSDFAILYRTNAQSRIIEEALNRGGKRNDHGNRGYSIPYKIYGGLSFFQRKEVKDAVSYFRLTVNPDDDEALRRIINYPARGIGDVTVTKVQKCALAHEVSMWQVINDPIKYGLNANAGTLRKLASFRELIATFIEQNAKGVNAYELAKLIVERSKLISVLIGDNTPENISRQENLNELVNSISEFVQGHEEEGDTEVALVDFLAEVSLLSDIDQSDNSGDCVTLMTVHASKGLEFKNVIIVGTEEDLFPAKMSADTRHGIEEERRLLYVAITRAAVTCTITFATSRFLNGQSKSCVASRFLQDIDTKYLNVHGTASTTPSFGTRTFGGGGFGSGGHFAPKAVAKEPVVARPRHLTPISNATSRVSSPVTSGMATGAGAMGKHSIGELAVGTKIRHERFGLGVVTEIDVTAGEEKIVARFDNVGDKKLLLKFAKFAIL